MVFSLLLALFASRGFLFRPGWIAYSADFSVHSSRRLELENWLTGWNHFVGDDNSPILSAAPVWLLLLSVVGTALAQKLFVLGILFTASASAFFVAERWARVENRPSQRSVLIGALCGLCYTINPWVATEIIHYLYVWMYALLPVTVFFMARAVRSDSTSAAIGNVLLVGVVAVATFTAYGLLFHLLVAGLFLAVDVVASRGERGASIRRAVLLLITLLVTAATVGSYSTLPVLLGFESSFVGGTSWALFTTEAMFILSPFTPFTHAVRGMFRFTTAQLLVQTLPRPLFLVAGVLSSVPLLLVGARVLVRRIDRRDVVLLALLVFSLLIANGTNWPTGRHYATIAQGPFGFIAFVLFKGPYKLVALVVAALVLLSTRTVIALFAAPALRAVALTSAAGMVLWSVLLGSPLLTGDLASYMRPVEPPPGYLETLRSISGSDLEGGRAVWLPTDISGEQHPAWAPRRRMLSLIGGTVSPPGGWLGQSPVSSRGTSYSPPAAGRIFDQLFTYALMNRPDVDLASLLRLAGRAHVVVQRDVVPQRYGAEAGALAAQLRSHPELQLVAETPQLLVFSALPRHSVMGPGYRLAVGGHEQLLLSAAAGRDGGGSERAVLANDMPTDRPIARQLVEGASRLYFSPGQDWQDLALNSWPAPGQLYALASYVAVTDPLSPWNKTFFESNQWVGTTAHTGWFDGQRFGPALSGPFLFTTDSATVGFRARAAARAADVWVRAFVNPGAGGLEVSVGDRPVRAVSLSNDPALGWKWFRLHQKVEIAAGEEVSVRVVAAARGVRSVSAVDQVAVLPGGAMPDRVDQLKEQAAGVPVGIGGAWDSFLTVPAGLPGAGPDPAAARLVQVPRPGAYRVGVSGLSGPDVFANASVGGAPLAQDGTDGGWRYSRAVDLRAESYVLRLPGLDPRAFVTLEEVSPALAGEVRAGTRAAPPSSSRLRSFSEPFNGGWRVNGGEPGTHFRLSGFVNGFLVDEPGDVYFGPDAWVRRARFISLAAATVAVVAGIALSGGRVASRIGGTLAGGGRWLRHRRRSG